MDVHQRDDAGGAQPVDEQPVEDGEPQSKRIKLEAPSVTHSSSDDTSHVAPSSAGLTDAAPSTSTPPAAAPFSAAVETALHGLDEVNCGLAHSTVAGELLEHERAEQKDSLQPLEHGEHSSKAESTDAEPQPDTALDTSPASASSSLAASPPPAQPLRPPSPPPLGKYQCDNCSALLTYSSLTEIYHCPLCYHTFTLYPPLAPASSPPLFPLDYSPAPPLSQWASTDLYLYLLNVPGLSSLAARAASAGMDGRYFLAMHVSDMVEEFGLWGSAGAGGSVEGNAALVVQLLNAQRLLRGEPVRSVAEEMELVSRLVGMQTVAVPSKPQQQSRSGRKARDRAERQRREAKDAADEEAEEAEAESAAVRSAAKAAPARPVKRKQYRIPVASLPPRDPPTTTAASALDAAMQATVMSLNPAQLAAMQQPVTATPVPVASAQPPFLASGDAEAGAFTPQVAAARLAEMAAAVAEQSTATDDNAMADVQSSALDEM